MTIEKLMADSNLKEKFVLEKLLMHFLWVTREALRVKSSIVINDDILEQVLTAYKKYVDDKMPMEYILGYVEFFETKFFVNSDTLIPRPETEYMVLAISEYLQNIPKNQNILIDLWTGCGVLGISVLLQNPQIFEKVYFTDISDEALKVAQKNYERLVSFNREGHKGGVKDAKFLGVEFLESDLLEFLDSGRLGKISEDLVIVANLPYIPDEMFDENSPENVKNWEPRFAFVGGEDGLDLYRNLFKQISDSGRFGGDFRRLPENSWKLYQNKKKSSVISENLQSSLVMFLEMMTWQVDILRKEFEWLEFEEVKTFHFNIRIVRAMCR